MSQRQRDLKSPVQVDPRAVGRGEAERVEGRHSAILEDPLAGAQVPPDVRLPQFLAGEHRGCRDHRGHDQSIEQAGEAVWGVVGLR